MKMLQEIACQRTLPRSLKRKLSVSRLGKEQMLCWIVGKKGTIPLFPYEKGQGKTFHYVHYCTKCHILQWNFCWGSYFPRIAGMKSCLCTNDLVPGDPKSTSVSHNLLLWCKQRDHLVGTCIPAGMIRWCYDRSSHHFSDVSLSFGMRWFGSMYY